MPSFDFISSGLRTIRIESGAVNALSQRLDGEFSKACELILNCGGRVVVTGMGKSGHIARKIAATLASTGTPAFFVHPAEASHGDLGKISLNDAVIALSNSGDTVELYNVIHYTRRNNIPLIAITSKL